MSGLDHTSIRFPCKLHDFLAYGVGVIKKGIGNPLRIGP
jgi:hypothetical protein